MKTPLIILLGLMLCGRMALAATADLAWTDNANNEDGFVLERQLNGSPWQVVAAAIGANITAYSDSTLQDGILPNTYCYRVAAFNAVGASAYSNAACKTLAGAQTPDGTFVPPAANISNVVTRADVWSLGSENLATPGNYWVLRNNARVFDASGSKLALCNGTVHVLGRSKTWWRFVGSWVNLNTATPPCNPPAP